MKTKKNRLSIWRTITLFSALFIAALNSNLHAQLASTYVFTTGTAPFIPLAGGTPTSLGLTEDDAMSIAFPIGFNFNFGYSTYTQVMASTNGQLLFGTGRTQAAGNDLATTVLNQRPGIAPLWDDQQVTSGVTYQLSGTAPSQVLTVEWLNMEWNFQSGTAVISYQVRLYETTNVIECIYRQESTPYNPGTTSGGSIGLLGTDPGDFLSLQNTSASPATSTSVAMNTITTKPATDQVYIFTPPLPGLVVVSTGTSNTVTSSGAVLSGSITETFPPPFASGVVVGTSPNPTRGTPGVTDSTTNPVLTSGSFSKSIAGLTNGTVYYYRTYAENSVGISYGPDSTFTTDMSATAPTISQSAATNITITSADIEANILSNGGDVITTSGIVYSTTPTPSLGDPGVIDVTTTPVITSGIFITHITGVTQATKYYYRAYAVNSAGTAYSAEDSFVTNPIISVFPYAQNFDAGITSTGWHSEATGGINDWILGTPAKTFLSSAASGLNCWVTKTTGNYANSHNAAVVSSTFDFTSAPGDPVFEFKHKFKTEAGWDAAVLEMSIGGGPWIRLDSTLGTGGNFNTIHSQMWYNSTSINGPVAPGKWSENSSLFSSNVNGWITSRTILTGAMGQSDVKVRLRFASDLSGTQEGWAFDDILVFMPTLPDVVSGSYTNVTTGSATLSGTIISNGNSLVTKSGFIYSNTTNQIIGDPGVVDSSSNPLIANGSLNMNIGGLLPVTTYYYRAYATNALGTTYGADSSFTTTAAATIPLMQTSAATTIGYGFATLHGTVVTDGGATITSSGVLYGTTPDPTAGDPGIVDSTTNPLVSSPSAGFSFGVKGLEAGTKYYYRTYAVNSVGIAYSEQDSFTTTPAIMSTGSAANITTIKATLSGSIRVITGPGDNSTITASGIVLGTSPEPSVGAGVTDSTTNPVINTGIFSKNIGGLSPGVTYHYRAYATNSFGTFYGPDSSFTTNLFTTIPHVVQSIPSFITDSSAMISAEILSDGGLLISQSGIVYSTSATPSLGSPGVSDVTTTPVVTSGAFIGSIGGLTHSTKYYCRAYAINADGTAYSAEDSFYTAPVISTFPYAQNFDTAGMNTGWHSESAGGINEWVLGTPAKAFLSAAASGTRCWVTNTSGNYSNGHNASIASPRFDFTSATGDPVIRFKHKFQTEAGWDAAILEISIAGAAWIKLDNTLGSGSNFNTPTSTSWYNSFSGSGPVAPSKWSENSLLFSSAVNGWITSQTILTGSAGQSDVRVRLRFASDGSGTGEGWAFDDILVTLPVTPEVVSGSSSNITTNLATLSGTIVSNGNSPVTASGIVYGTTPGPLQGDPGVVDSATNPVVTNGIFNVHIAGLLPLTTYYYRAYATNAMGTTYGADSTFTTYGSAIAPSVAYLPVYDMTTTMATLGGDITSDGGDPVIGSGIVYSSIPAPVIGGPGVVDSVTNPTVPMGPFTFTVTGLTHSTTYYYRAYAINGVDTSYSSEGSFTTAKIISSFPYIQDFESGADSWTITTEPGLSNNWVLGTPVKAYHNSAHSGINTWVTKLSGTYDNNVGSSVVSPELDFTSVATDPVIRFYHKFVTEANWDALILQISVNGGAWIKLDPFLGSGSNFNTAGSYAWYNHAGGSGPVAPPKFSSNNTGIGSDAIYSTQINGWIESATVLTGVAGQSNVKVRFFFGSDGSGVQEGWAIDDITIEEIVAPALAASAVLTSNVTDSTTDASWTNGDGTGRIVVARLTADAAVAPVDYKRYASNTVFGNPDSTGTGNYVVYNGTASTVAVTNLEMLTDYSYDVYEYNGKYMHIRYAAAATNNAVTLPVTLTSFTANAKTNDVLLNWTTASETNNKGFDIERSVDGRSFEKVDFVKGAGNSSRTLNYTLTDAKAFAEANSNVLYYRLKQVDFNGKFAYSQIVKVSRFAEKATALSVYPNPFNASYSVSFDAANAAVATVKMVDLQGRLVAEHKVEAVKGNNNITVENLNSLQAGIYFVKVTVDGETQVVKLVKN